MTFFSLELRSTKIISWLYPGGKVCITGCHVTSCNQGSSNDQGRQRRETLGTRLNNYPSYVISNVKRIILHTTHTRHSHSWRIGLHVFFLMAAPQKNPNSFAVLPFINRCPATTYKNSSKARHSSCKLEKTLQQEFPFPKFTPSILNINRTWLIKYPVPIVIGVMQEKPAGVSKLVKKEHIRIVLMAETL